MISERTLPTFNPASIIITKAEGLRLYDKKARGEEAVDFSRILAVNFLVLNQGVLGIFSLKSNLSQSEIG